MTVTTINGPVVQTKIDDTPWQKLFGRAPRVVYKHLRDALGGMYGEHRREWLAKKQVQFERGGLQAATVGSRASAAAGTFDARRTFTYDVHPEQREVAEGTKVDLNQLSAEAGTSSPVALGLERGGSFTANNGKQIPIPIGITLDSRGRVKSRWTTPKRFIEASAKQKELVPIRMRSGKEALFWKKPLGRGKNKRFALLPAYQLVDRVNRKPRLHYYDTWDALQASRDRRLSRANGNAVKEIEGGY